MLKTFHYSFDWTPKSSWVLPKDEFMYQNLFTILDAWMTVMLSHLMDHQAQDKPSICLQAGGAMGMWPLRLSYFFDKVVTFEPLEVNMSCLMSNCQERDNIEFHPYALLDIPQWVQMEYSKKVKNSYGAHHVAIGRDKQKGDDVWATTVDLGFYENVDLIQFDLEGAELYALKGADTTIAENRPIIILEDRPLPWMKKLGTEPGQAVAWLQKRHGYRVVQEFHGDKFMVPK